MKGAFVEMRTCRRCVTEFEVPTWVSGATGGQQQRTVAHCPTCGAEHRLFHQSKQWLLVEDDELEG